MTISIEPSARKSIARRPAKSLNSVQLLGPGRIAEDLPDLLCFVRGKYRAGGARTTTFSSPGNIKIPSTWRYRSAPLGAAPSSPSVWVPQYMMMTLASVIHSSTRACHWSSDNRTRAAPGSGTVSFGEPMAMKGPNRWK